MSDSDVVEVYLATDEPQAYFLKNLLEDSGIKANVVNDMLVIPAGETVAPRIWVSQADEARAREILLGWEDSQDEPASTTEEATWKCSGCGADVEADFEVCWNCEQPRSET